MQLLDIPTRDSGLVEIIKFVVKLAFLYFFLSRLKDRVLQLLGGSGIKASASHILVSSEAQCQALKQELGAGANFGELAKKHSKCPSGKNGGHLGSFSPGSMVPTFDKVVFDPACAVGVVHGPVNTSFGSHLILIESRDEPEKLFQLMLFCRGECTPMILQQRLGHVPSAFRITSRHCVHV